MRKLREELKALVAHLPCLAKPHGLSQEERRKREEAEELLRKAQASLIAWLFVRQLLDRSNSNCSEKRLRQRGRRTGPDGGWGRGAVRLCLA